MTLFSGPSSVTISGKHCSGILSGAGHMEQYWRRAGTLDAGSRRTTSEWDRWFWFLRHLESRELVLQTSYKSKPIEKSYLTKENVCLWTNYPASKGGNVMRGFPMWIYLIIDYIWYFQHIIISTSLEKGLFHWLDGLELKCLGCHCYSQTHQEIHHHLEFLQIQYWVGQMNAIQKRPSQNRLSVWKDPNTVWVDTATQPNI